MEKRKLQIRQISNKIKPLKDIRRHFGGVDSWIFYIRTALGMSAEQLAKKAGLARPTLYQLERSEKSKNINMKSLSSLAEAMDCEFVYAFIPRQSIETMIDVQANKKAKALIKESNLQMEFEDQAVHPAENRAQMKEMAEKIKYSKSLWDD